LIFPLVVLWILKLLFGAKGFSIHRKVENSSRKEAFNANEYVSHLVVLQTFSMTFEMFCSQQVFLQQKNRNAGKM